MASHLPKSNHGMVYVHKLCRPDPVTIFISRLCEFEWLPQLPPEYGTFLAVYTHNGVLCGSLAKTGDFVLAVSWL